jgi:hypothetical protein
VSARFSRLLALGVAGSTLVALAAGSAGAADDSTPPSGAFGFTTTGMTAAPIGGSGINYGEPTLATAPDGQHVIISTPGCGGVCYWRSSDDGATWSSVKTTGAGGDSEVDFVPQTDGSVVTLSADLAFGKTDSKQNSWINSSNDFGSTWSAPKTVSAGLEQDRQWFAHSPDGKTAYLVYHDFIAEAEVYAKGTYNATTKTFDWPQQDAGHPVNSPDQLAGVPNNPAAPPKPGDSVSVLDQGANTYSGPMLVDPNGQDLYVVYSISDAASNSDPNVGVPPYGPVRSIAVAHSSDGGTLWQNRYAVVAPSKVGSDGTKQQGTSGTMFPWGFIDPAGTVYVVFDSTNAQPGTDHYGFYYVYSKDKGASWSTPVRLDNLPQGAGAVVFNTGAAVSPGVIDVAWLQKDTGGLGTNDGQWYPWFAQISAADTAHPTIVGTQKMADVANHNGGVCIQGILCGIAPGSSDRSLLDFFELTVNPKTGMAEAAYAQNAHDRSGENGKGEVVFAKQTVQPPLNPGATLPETPYLPLLPLAAVAVLGGAILWRRRRTA